MDFEIPEEYRALQKLTLQFVEDELRPLEREMEDNEDLTPETWERLKNRSKELGLWAPFAAKEYGGEGIKSHLARMLMMEAMGSTCRPFRDLVGRGDNLEQWRDNEYLLEKYFLPAMKAERHGFGAITEPDAGSDQRSMKTTAVRDGDEWVINGSKHLISNMRTFGKPADYGVVYCMTDKEARRITPFVVDVGTPGFTIGRRQRMMGFRGMYLHELYFDNCRVPEDNRVGSMGRGLSHFLVGASLLRLQWGAGGVGAAQYCLDRCIDYAQQRVTFGKPLAARQAVQWMLVDSWMEIESTRWLVYRSTWALDQGEDYRFGYSACKILGPELACRVANRAIQIHGGIGATTDFPFERIWRDFRVVQILEGATEIQKFILARMMLGEVARG